jgi:hypothetical protein
MTKAEFDTYSPTDQAVLREVRYQAHYDWTAKDGRSNSSDKFQELTQEVARIIRNSAFDLIAGRSETVAGLIMAQLAHNYEVGPLNLPQMEIGPNGGVILEGKEVF